MAANDNVTVRIVGDASQVRPAIEQTGSEISSLEPMLAELNAQISRLSRSMVEGFSQGAAGGRALASGMHEARAATDAEGNALVRMVAKVHEGAESIRTFQMRAKAFAEVYVGIFAVETIARWAESLAAAAEKMEHLAAQTGMTVPQVQALSGAATMSGTSIDVLAKSLGMMDNRAVVAEGRSSSAGKAFRAMGIDAKDGSSNMERLLKIADHFKDMADGPEKAALAMQLFGRSGREMIPFLNQGSAAIEQLMEKSKDLGAVNEGAIEQGARLAASVNEAKVAWDGLKNIIMQGLGPALTEIVDGFVELVAEMKQSYDSGGAVKIIFEAIGEIVSGLIDIFHAVGLAIGEFFSGTSAAGLSWSDIIRDCVDAVIIVVKLLLLAFVGVKDGILAALYSIDLGFYELAVKFKGMIGAVKNDGQILGEFMMTLGRVCEDALMLHWGSIASDWDAGMSRIKNIVAHRAEEIAKTTSALRQHVQSDLNAIAGLGSSFGDFFKGLTTPYQPAHDAFKFNFGGGGGEAPDITNPAKEHGKKGKQGPSIAERLEAELEAQKTAWAEKQLLQDTAQQFSLQSEADFWAQALKRSDLGLKDRLTIEKKYVSAAQALQKERIDDQLAQYQLDLQAAGSNWDKKIEILREEQAFVVRMYGAESKEAKEAARAVLQAEQQKAKQLREINEEIAKGKEDAALAAIDSAHATAEAEVEMGRLSKSKLLDLEKQFENQRFEIQRTALLRRLEMMKADPSMDPVKYQQISNQIEALERAHQQKLTQIDRQAELERTQIQRNAISQMASGWAHNIAQMLTLQEGLAAGIKGIWQTIQQTIATAIESILQKWLEEQLSALILGKAQKIAEATGEIAANAAVAASGAYAATAAIPIIGPELAPAAAASAYAGAISWTGALGAAAAEGGDFNVREGLYHLHEKEMVLPAWAADPLRDMLGSRAANFNAPQGANDRGGGVHLHLHGQIIHNPNQLRRWFEDNHAAVGAGVRQFWRQGGNTSRNRA